MAKVYIVGPGHPLRGGLASFNHRLALQFLQEGHDCHIISYSLQYPSFLFPGASQYTSAPPPEKIKIRPLIHSVNPLNWFSVGRRLKNEKPDIVLVRYWLPFFGPALGTILRRIRKNRHTAILALTDNVIPHEKRPGDTLFTRYFLNSCDGFITMSQKVTNDLRRFEKQKPAVMVPHPLYDNFGATIPQSEARKYLGLNDKETVFLFFGFIRNYKGLDLLLDAVALLKKKNLIHGMKFLIAGEFYENPQPYLEQIQSNGLQDDVVLKNQFIPDEEVKYYFSAADGVVQPYRRATQSGVTPLAYHFEAPMIVTDVGGLPDRVPHGKAGLVCKPEAESIADSLLKFKELGKHYFLDSLREEKQKYSWSHLVQAVLNLAHDVQK
ncbi:MAG: glycosyltransferase [Chitinophagaceae bacterium]|nr:glycosyltransferase [Chitinophagaceae bacterium]